MTTTFALCDACESIKYAISELPEEDIACERCGGKADCADDCPCELIRRL